MAMWWHCGGAAPATDDDDDDDDDARCGIDADGSMLTVELDGHVMNKSSTLIGPHGRHYRPQRTNLQPVNRSSTPIGPGGRHYRPISSQMSCHHDNSVITEH